MSNYKYYLATVQSMQSKKAKLIDVINKMGVKSELIRLRFIILLFFIIVRLLNQYSNGNGINNNTNINHSNNMIHFINCGPSDSILIESNGKYGLVDSSNPYNGSINVVESVQIDKSIGEKHWPENSNNSVKAELII